jgi:hypothetical protein
MSEAQWIVFFFGILMCDMSLAASYFEAQEKARLTQRTTVINSSPQ